MSGLKPEPSAPKDGLSVRPLLAAGSLFILLAATWAGMPAALSRHYVSCLAGDTPERVAMAEEALRRMGPAAWGALRRGMADARPEMRIKCAAALAEMGDGAAGRELRLAARDGRLDGEMRRMAYERLKRVWLRRAGPQALGRLDTIRRMASDPMRKPSAEGARRVLEKLDRLIEDYPGYAEAYAARGEMRMALGLSRDAAADAYSALDNEDGHTGALIVLARAYYSMGMLDLALQALEDVEAAYPHDDPDVKVFREELGKAARDLDRRLRRLKRDSAPLA